MDRFYHKTLGATAGLNFMNFDRRPSSHNLFPAKGNEKKDLDIYFFEDKNNVILKKMKKSDVGKNIKKATGGQYLEFFDIERKKAFCFFKGRISMDFLVGRQLYRSFIAFQNFLDMIFLHSASIVVGGKLYLFAASSGGGKSTICDLARKDGLKVLDDEFCVIKRKRGRFYTGVFPCFKAPFDPYEERQLEGIFFLEKSKRNKIRTISTNEAINRALPEATSLPYDYASGRERSEYRKHVFRFLNSVLEKTDFGLLEFNKDTYDFSCLN
ncbi:MAG: hypothetical protein WBB66_00840 [Candidatus Omnitrophota bacterium]